MFSLFFSVICAWFAYFLPCFATYKTLSNRPVVEADVEKWCMYWSVIGALVGFEYVAEWFVSWLPFYWEIKTLFLLFLSLPQIQGSDFVYRQYMYPFFRRNEAQIDQGIVSIQSNALSFVQTKLSDLWQLLWSVINKTPANGQPPSNGAANGAPGTPPISLDTAFGLFKSYMNSAQARNNAPSNVSTPSMTPSASSTSIPRAPVASRTPSYNPSGNAAPPFPEPVHHQ